VTAETIEHLNHLQGVVQEVKQFLANHRYPDDLRTVIVIGFTTQIIEHLESMLLLIRGEKVGSAFALARSVVEGMYRGLWINFVATDLEVARFERADDIGLTMTELAQAIDRGYRAEHFFENLKQRSWDALNSYAHTGMLQLGRRFRAHNVEPTYTEAEVFEVTTAVTTCILILTSKFLAVQNFPDDCRSVEVLIETYGPAARGRSPQQQPAR
jgi:hypothetical protein